MQRSILTSTTEAEYQALAYAGKEAIWIQALLEQLGRVQYSGGPATLYGDNQGAIALVKNPEFHARTKHIDVAAHYTRELVEDGRLTIEYIPTASMLADCLTKPLKPVQRNRNVEGLGLQPWT